MKRLAVVTTIIILLLVSVTAVLAAPLADVVVEDGEVINNDVVLFGENLEIQPGAVVNSDVIVFGGNALIAGEVNGDVAVFGGNLETTDGTVITGDCVLLGSGGTLRESVRSNTSCTAVEHQGLSQMIGAVTNFAVPPVPPIPAAPEAPDAPELPEMPGMPPFQPSQPSMRSANSWIGRLFAGVAGTFMMGLLGMVAAAVAPRHLQQIQATARQKPGASGVVGVLTAVAVPSLILLLIPISALLTLVCIGLLGFPIILALSVAFVAAIFIGWIVMGTILGQWLFGRWTSKNGQPSLPLVAGVGTALLTFAFSLLGLLPFDFATGLLGFIISSVGLGAVTLTQFGRKPYPNLPGNTPTSSKEDEDKIRIVLQTLPDES